MCLVKTGRVHSLELCHTAQGELLWFRRLPLPVWIGARAWQTALGHFLLVGTFPVSGDSCLLALSPASPFCQGQTSPVVCWPGPFELLPNNNSNLEKVLRAGLCPAQASPASTASGLSSVPGSRTSSCSLGWAETLMGILHWAVYPFLTNHTAPSAQNILEASIIGQKLHSFFWSSGSQPS